jgi:hypothetical protein
MYMSRGTLVSVRDGLHLRPGTMAAYSCDIMNGPRALPNVFERRADRNDLRSNDRTSAGFRLQVLALEMCLFTWVSDASLLTKKWQCQQG